MLRLPAVCLFVVLLQSIPLAVAREVRHNNGPRHLFGRSQYGNESSSVVATVTHVDTITSTDCPESSTSSGAILNATIPAPIHNVNLTSTIIPNPAALTIPQAATTPIQSLPVLPATLNATATSTINPAGGVLSIPVSASTPIQSLLATQQECEILMDGQLPPLNSIPSQFNFSGNVRTYYVAAEQISWNYAPTGWDNWLGVPLAKSPRAAGAGYGNLTGSIGGDGGYTWEKAVYRGYTDATFTQQTEQADTNGINGPLLRAEVNDMIQILFVNNLKENYATMHSMGLYYGKQYEGSLYPNTTDGQTTAPQEQDAVPPGGCAVYKWIATDSQAPVDGQDSRLWSYHSYVNMSPDLNTGLVGPIIVYNQGKMEDTMAANREFVLNFQGFAEQGSWLAGENAEKYGGYHNVSQATAELIGGPHAGNESYWVPQMTNLPTVQLTSAQAPTFYALNGYVFSNGPDFQICRDDPVIWYVMAYGDYSHVFHMHGNNFQAGPGTPWKAAMSINTGEMFTLNMNAQLPGIWQILCHVNMHQAFGMEQNYIVYETEFGGGVCPLPALTAKLVGSP